MAEISPLDSLKVLEAIAEQVPLTGPQRDEVRKHIQNIRIALEPKVDA